MARILAIDTSTSACSVALSVEGEIHEQFQNIPQSHTQRLLPMVDDLLGVHKINLKDLDALALTTGPGSFTGLRIGLGTIQGLAFGANKPIIGVSSLKVMAKSASRLLEVEEGAQLLPSFDARMREVYWGCYTTAGETLLEDTVSSPTDLLKTITENTKPVVAIGDGYNTDEFKNLESDGVSMCVPDFYPHAYDVVALALEEYKDGAFVSPLDLEPTYIRNEVSWKKHQKIRSAE